MVHGGLIAWHVSGGLLLLVHNGSVVGSARWVSALGVRYGWWSIKPCIRCVGYVRMSFGFVRCSSVCFVTAPKFSELHFFKSCKILFSAVLTSPRLSMFPPLRSFAHNSHPPRRNLARRGMKLHTKCPVCQRLDGDGGHLFLKCKLARHVWRELKLEREWENPNDLV